MARQCSLNPCLPSPLPWKCNLTDSKAADDIPGALVDARYLQYVQRSATCTIPTGSMVKWKYVQPHHDHQLRSKDKRTLDPRRHVPPSTSQSSDEEPPQTNVSGTGADGNSSANAAVVAIELGASHVEVWRRTADRWEPLQLRTDFGPDKLLLSRIIPTIVAVRKPTQSLSEGDATLLYGDDALRNKRGNPEAWETFYHLKSALMARTENGWDWAMLEALAEEVGRARHLGQDLRCLAKEFFAHFLDLCLREAVSGRLQIFVNIIDNWDNQLAQEFAVQVENIMPGAEVHCVDECYAGVIGSLSKSTGEPRIEVVFDNGHSTMTSAIVDIQASGFEIVQFGTLSCGAERINMAAESATRKVLADTESDNIDAAAPLEVQTYIDNTFKPSMDRNPPRGAKFGFSGAEWRTIVENATRAEAELHECWLKETNATLRAAYDRWGSERTITAVWNGRASKSPLFDAKLGRMVKEEFPDLSIVEGQSIDRTTVMMGLQQVADEPRLGALTSVPCSLWIRSDDSARAPPTVDDDEEAIRFCQKGRSLTPSSGTSTLTHPLYPLRLDLEHDEPGNAVLDVSVYMTPRNLQDQAGDDDETRMHQTSEGFFGCQAKKLDLLQKFETPLQLHATKKCHAHKTYRSFCYLCVDFSRFRSQIIVLYAEDGHKIRGLEKVHLSEIVERGCLKQEWRVHGGARMKCVSMGRIVRNDRLVN